MKDHVGGLQHEIKNRTWEKHRCCRSRRKHERNYNLYPQEKILYPPTGYDKKRIANGEQGQSLTC